MIDLTWLSEGLQKKAQKTPASEAVCLSSIRSRANPPLVVRSSIALPPERHRCARNAGHVPRPAIVHEIMRVIHLVGTYCLRARARHAVRQSQRIGPLGKAICMAYHGADHQPRAVFHQDMPLLTEDGQTLPALFEQTCIRISAQLMRFIAAPFAFPVGLRVAPTTGPRTIRPVLATKTLVTRTYLGERAVHRETLPGQQAPLVGQSHDFGKERLHDPMLERPSTVLREDGVVPNDILRGQSDEPAKQQVVLHFLHQHALAAHRAEDLQQQRAPASPVLSSLDRCQHSYPRSLFSSDATHAKGLVSHAGYFCPSPEN
jgi:hypothetical protein